MDTEEAIKVIKDMIQIEWRRQFPPDLATYNIEALEMAAEALQKQEPVKPTYQPWMSVEDRLPDGDVASVLIHTNKGGVSEGQYYPCIKSWKQFRWSVEDADVTHWCPLPEPPKGYEPTTRKDRTVEEVAISKTETTSNSCWYCGGVQDHKIVSVKTVVDELGRELPAYDVPYNYCPNCGQKINWED